MILKTKITTTEERTADIPIPCFWRNKEETIYVGLLDEKTVVEIVKDQFESSVRNFNNEIWDAGLQRVTNAYTKFYICTEAEFLEAFDKTMESMSLNPILKP